MVATLTVTANSPVGGAITWSAFQFVYQGITYNVTGGNTTLLYSYFIYANRTSYVAPVADPVTGVVTGSTASATLVSSATIPATLTDDDCLWLINRNGIPLNVQRTEIVDGSLIVTQSIVGTSIAARTIDATNIKADIITGAEIKAGTITADELAISTLQPDSVINGSMEDFDAVSFVPFTWTPSWGRAGGTPTYSQSGAVTAIHGSNSTIMAVPASGLEGLASQAAPVNAGASLSGRKLLITAAFRASVTGAPVSVRVYWGTTSAFTIASGLSANTGAVPTVVEVLEVNTGNLAALAPTPSVAAGVTNVLDYWTGATASNTYLLTAQVAVPAAATWMRIVLLGGQTTYATAVSYTWDYVRSQSVIYSTYVGDGVIVTRLLAADAVLANNIAIIGQRDPVTFQPVNGTNRVEIEPGGIYVYKRSAGGVDTMQAAMDNTTGAFIAGQLVTSGSGTGITPGFVNSSGRVILDGTGLKGIYRDGTGVDTLKLSFDATTGNVNVAGAVQAGGTITGSLVRSGVAANSTSRTELDSAGLRLINRDAGGIDTTVVNISAAGAVGSIAIVGGTLTTPTITTPSVSNGTLTGSVVRTSTTVGDGSVSSAGVQLDSTGLKGFPASSAVANTTIDTATGVLTATGATFTGTVTGSLVRSAVPTTSANRVEFDSAGLRLIRRNASNVDTTVAELRTSDGTTTLTNATMNSVTANSITTSGTVNLGGTLTVSGPTTLNSTLTISGGAIASTNFNVSSTGVATMAGATINGSTQINGTLFLGGTNATAISSTSFTLSNTGVVSAASGSVGGFNITGSSIASASGGLTLNNNGAITGGTISGTTVTGALFRTAASGSRIVLDGSVVGNVDKIFLYDAGTANGVTYCSGATFIAGVSGSTYNPTWSLIGTTGEVRLTGQSIGLYGSTNLPSGSNLTLAGGGLSVTAASGNSITASGSVSITSGNLVVAGTVSVTGGTVGIADGTIQKTAGAPFILNSTMKLALGAAPTGPRYVVGDGANQLYYGALVASLREFKRDIVDLPRHDDDVLALRPIQYRYKKSMLHDDEHDELHTGLLVDEVEALGFDDLLMYGADHKVISIHYDRIAVLLIPIVRDLRQQVNSLQALVAAKK